jgi:hypothetical protein
MSMLQINIDIRTDLGDIPMNYNDTLEYPFYYTE